MKTAMTKKEQEINRKAHKLDNASEELKKLRAKCKHRFVGTWDGFDRCEICGQPGQPDR